MFIRGFRVARTFRILPKHLKAAGSPPPDSDGYGSEPDVEAVSIAATPKVRIPPIWFFSIIFLRLIDVSKYRDPLHILLDYIAEVRPCVCLCVMSMSSLTQTIAACT